MLLEPDRDQEPGRAARILPDPMAPPKVTIDAPQVTEPPESVFQLVREGDRDVARAFYRKYIDVRGLPFLTSGEVDDLALQRTHEIVTHMLAGRPVDPDYSGNQQYELRVKRLDIQFDEAVTELCELAMADGKWRGTHTVADRFAYWTAGVLAYFDAVGQDAAPLDARHPIRTREQLQDYDPGLFALVDETMAYANKVDWRYRPYRD